VAKSHSGKIFRFSVKYHWEPCAVIFSFRVSFPHVAHRKRPSMQKVNACSEAVTFRIFQLRNHFLFRIYLFCKSTQLLSATFQIWRVHHEIKIISAPMHCENCNLISLYQDTWSSFQGTLNKPCKCSMCKDEIFNPASKAGGNHSDRCAVIRP
jgi:hypothetical protein